MSEKHENCSGHDHHHDFSHQQNKKHTLAFRLGIFLNLLFVFIEIYYGYLSSSLSLIGDALHNLGDVFSLILAAIAFYVATLKPSKKYSFGYKKFSILVAFFNSLTLLATSFYIIYEAYQRFLNPVLQNSQIMIWVSFFGFIINFGTAKLFHVDHRHQYDDIHHQAEDVNIKGAYLHLLGDAFISLGVCLTGFIISWTHQSWIDPVVSAFIVLFIIWSTIPVLSQSWTLLMNGVPKGLDSEKIKNEITELHKHFDFNQIHIWAVGTSDFAINLKLKTSSNNLSEVQNHKVAIEKMLKEKFKISFVNIDITFSSN